MGDSGRAERTEHGKEEKWPLSGKKVLVVDDNRNIRDTVDDILTNLGGAEVLLAGNEEEALGKIKKSIEEGKNTFDLLVINLSMLEAGELRLLEALKEENLAQVMKQMAIIVMTAGFDEDNRENLKKKE